jgi:hypothetical protein
MTEEFEHGCPDVMIMQLVVVVDDAAQIINAQFLHVISKSHVTKGKGYCDHRRLQRSRACRSPGVFRTPDVATGSDQKGLGNIKWRG